MSIGKNRYFVDSEHVRSERRIYWVADSHHIKKFNAQPVTDPTTSERKAQRECDKLNGYALTSQK